MAQWVKPPLRVPASHITVQVQVPASLLPMQLPAEVSQKRAHKKAQVLGPCLPCRELYTVYG